MRLPTLALIFAATAPSGTVKANFSDTVPGMVTIAVPETRELEVFAAMLERRGARVLRCPLVAIRDAPDPAPVLAFARAFAQEAFDDVVLTTGEGLRRILGCIERHEPELRAAFLA